MTRSEGTASVQEALDAHPFRPPVWLRSAHLQTLWGPFFRPRPRVDLRFEAVASPDGDPLHLYSFDGEPDRPQVVLLHGLEGTPASKYVRGQARALAAAGWGVCAMAFRSCDGAPHQARRLYHLGETTDLDFVVRRLIDQSPGRSLYLSGFSLGGNVIAKWLGELGDAVPGEVRGAAITSPPFDPVISGPVIDRALGGLYTRRFLRTLIPKALEKARQYPAVLDAEAIRSSKTFVEFDTYATAALHGFEDANDYWRRCGCGRFLDRVRRPLLMVAARDDPFNPAIGLPTARTLESPWLFPSFADRGGHVGFVYGLPWRTRHWAEEQSVRFFRLLEG